MSGRCFPEKISGLVNFQVASELLSPKNIRWKSARWLRAIFRQKEHSAYHGGVQFRGVLEVTDREHFIQTYQAGIGGAKGFGFGLLLLSPVNL